MDEIWNEALLRDKAHTLSEGLAWLQTTAAVKSGAWFDQEEGEEEEDSSGKRSSPGGVGGVGGDGGSDDDALDSHIQQKIIPWDNLDLVRWYHDMRWDEMKESSLSKLSPFLYLSGMSARLPVYLPACRPAACAKFIDFKTR